jgi:hypothetical protein
MTRTRLAPGPLCLELEIAEKSGGRLGKLARPHIVLFTDRLHPLTNWIRFTDSIIPSLKSK